MFTKFTLLSLVALALAKPQLPAAQYPAGVSPHDCPGFPICDNARLHMSASTWQQPPQPQWNAPAWHQEQQHQWNAPAATAAGGDKYPAGVNPHTCPNYPYCDVNVGGAAAHVSPLPGFTERLYPAGVSPHMCPNYPDCS